MTIQELAQRESYLTFDDAQTGIYLIPSGKRGWTSFPVTEEVAVQKTHSLEDGTEEQYEETVKQLKEGAVLVTPEEYEGLQAGTHVWENGKVIKYVEPANVTQAKAFIEQVEQTKQQVDDARSWLKAHDYIGVKIAQAMLIGDEAELAAMKEQYASVIEEAKVKRNEVNAYTKWLNDNEAAIQAAQDVIQNEH